MASAELKLREDSKKKVGKKIKKTYTNPISLSNAVKKNVIGHSNEIDVLCLEITNYFLKLNNKRLFKNYKKNNIFITGTSGVGKTFVVEEISKLIEVNFLSIDITAYTSTGFQGENVKSILTKLRYLQEEDFGKPCIVFIDEIDKLKFGGTQNSQNKDISGMGVQEELLKLIESVGVINNVDMSKVLFICSGAFEGIETILKDNNKMGFNNNHSSQECIRKHINRTHLIKYGLMPEFIGRFHTLLNFSSLSKQNLNDILSSKSGILEDYKILCSLHDISVRIEHNFTEELISVAMKENLGARSLYNSFIPYANNVLFKALKNKKTTVVLSPKTYLDFIKVNQA